MAEINPPYAMQNAGATHTAENDRMHLSGIFAGARVASSMVSRGGIARDAGGAFGVTQTGSPTMSVQVASGIAYVPGSEGSTQGVYACTNNGTKTISITAAHASLPRIDLIVLQVRDSAYSGASNDWIITSITGTAASSPVAPTVPNNNITLAQIAVGAAVTSIVNANITDARYYCAADGGMISISNLGVINTALFSSGQSFYDRSSNFPYYYNGTALARMSPYRVTQTLSGIAASITFSNIPTDLVNLSASYTTRCTDTGFQARGLYMRVNSNSGINNYKVQSLQQSAGTLSSSAVDDTKAVLGLTSTNGASAGYFASGEVVFQGWNSPHSGSLGFNFQTTNVTFTGTTVNNKWCTNGGGIFLPAGPYTSLTFFPELGSWEIGTSITVTGY